MASSEKKYDVIIWGASGFTGRLVAEYFAKQYGVNSPELRWAIAGRNEEKLRSIARQIGAEAAPIVKGDAEDPTALRNMVAQTKVVCTTVGPYQKYGSDLVAACAELGVDYVDLCGEPAWMRHMIDAHEETAQKSGARIVHSCGFDSIPFDLGVLYLQNLSKDEFGEPCVEVKGRVKAMRGKFSGGTVASMITTIEAGRDDPMVRKASVDPYVLAVDEGADRPKQPSSSKVCFDEEFNAWATLFVMAPINTRNVHRSNMKLNYAYGTDFLYSEMMMAKSKNAAKMADVGLRAFVGGLIISPVRAFMKKMVLPKPGEGPNAKEREEGFYHVLFAGRTKDGQQIITSVKGDRDPGYGSTCKMLGEAAICLAHDCVKGAPGGGFWTPASAMGQALIERLQKNAGLTFERREA